ncbi:MAG: SHD1 domain-containing protein [Akkermansiaceae bacterium]|jgi:hypothetical protein|nr:SHD1 domain-containing protein [Akkermansiaceae bacterium]
MKHWLAAGFLILSLHAPAAEPSTETRIWTSVSGTKVEASFVSASPNAIVLRKSDGTTLSLSPSQLAPEDLLVASRLAEEAKAKAQVKNEDPAEEKARLLRGPLTYGLSNGHENWPEDRKKIIVQAMEEAIVFLNRHAKFKKHVTANNSPGTPTADANFDGWINWGGTINRRVALHEISHTLGIGTHPEWRNFVKDGKWTGRHAIAQLKELDGPDAVLHADHMHFWPYGLNFDNESSPESDLKFIKMVEAFRKDLGIP